MITSTHGTNGRNKVFWNNKRSELLACRASLQMPPSIDHKKYVVEQWNAKYISVTGQANP